MPQRKAKTAKPAKTEPAEGYRQTLHIGCDADALAELDAIAERMRKHPIYGRLHSKVSRERAALFAIVIAHSLEEWPAIA